MTGDRMCPLCGVTGPIDPSRDVVTCASCRGEFATERGIERLARNSAPHWLLIRLLWIVAVSTGLAAVDRLAAFFVWACSSIVTIGIARWHTARFERLHPIAALPSAAIVPGRPARRALPPPTT